MKKCVAGFVVLTIALSLVAAESDPPKDFSANLRQIELVHADVNGIDIAYKVLGDRKKPAILMIMGLGGSHILWGDNLPYQLVDAGYQVVLFDNRDVGDSQRLDEYGNPIIWWEMLKNFFGFEVTAHYDLGDMAQDSIALMDELHIQRAHIVGASMGGMIAQVLAARYPERAYSLTSIMSSPGLFADNLPPPGQPENSFIDPLPGETESEATARLRHIGLYLDSMPRQIMAIIKSGDRSEEVRTITIPTLVLHGENDTLVPLAHGEYTAKLIEGSKFVSFKGMGHNMPVEVMPAIVSNMVRHMSDSEATAGVGAE